jgi:hypothetical protein
MRFLHSRENIDFLTRNFGKVDFALYQSDDSNRFISCFVARFSDGVQCESIWKQINNEIAINFQAQLQNEFAAWNIYLALVTPLPVSRDLKYKIENDRFALRKIVFSYVEAEAEIETESDESVRARIDGEINATVDVGDDAPVLSFLESAIFGKDLELYPNILELSEASEISLVRTYLSKVPQLPMDGREKSAMVRKQHIEELIGLLLKT